MSLGTGDASLEGERKTVTILFADIKGSMELMEDLDPEEARAIVDPALNLMMEAVQRYGGYVAQSTGDGIFAMFGAPVAYEDHPQRALYAALRMQEELKRYSDRNRSEGRLPVQVRIGVNSGEVVVRSIQTGEAHSESTSPLDPPPVWLRGCKLWRRLAPSGLPSPSGSFAKATSLSRVSDRPRSRGLENRSVLTR